MQFPGSDGNYHGDMKRIIHLNAIVFKVMSGIGKQRSALTHFHKETSVAFTVVLKKKKKKL